MKRILVAGSLAAALSLSSACSGGGGTATNTAATNTAANRATPASNAANTAATPASTNASANAAAPAGASQDFTLVNQTGVEINALYISPHDADDWEEDILGRDTLPSGETLDIKFTREEKAAMWDLRVEDKQGNSIEWENLNLLQISKLTLRYADGKATAETE